MKASDYAPPGPLDTEPTGPAVLRAERLGALLDALSGVELGDFDRAVAGQLAVSLDDGSLRTVVSLILRARSARRPVGPVVGRVGFDRLLAAYQAERDGSVEALTYAQHITERLVVEDVFGRLARLRADLADKSDQRDLGVVIDCALFELDAILGEA